MLLRFENPTALFGLIGIFALLLFFLYRRRYYPSNFRWRRATVILLSLTFCVFGLARPQGGTKVSEPLASRSNLFIAIDVSKSMLAEDISPSRNQFSLIFVEKLLEQLTHTRIALFPFALTGYLQIPLTSDLSALSDVLPSLTPTVLSSQGTDFNQVLSDLFTAISKSEATATQRGEDWAPPQVLFISDGETHVPLRDDSVMPYRAKKIPIFTLGVGTPSGNSIPEDSRFGTATQVLRDKKGAIITTKLNQDSLQKISSLTGGEYYQSKLSETYRLTSRLQRSMKLGRLTTSFKLEQEFYPWLFLLAFLGVFTHFLSSRWEYAIRMLLIPFLFVAATKATADEDPEHHAASSFNKGIELLKAGNGEAAAEAFQESALTTQDPVLKKKAWYNLGNSFLKLGDPQQALSFFQQAYDVDTPDSPFNQDANTRISENIALATKIKKMMEEQQKSGKPNSEGSDGEKGQGADPKGPKQFQADPLSDNQKKKMMDLISQEERQAMQRIQEKRNSKLAPTDKPW